VVDTTMNGTKEPTNKAKPKSPTIDLFKSDLRPMQYWAIRAEDKIRLWAQGKAEGESTGFSEFDKYFRMVDGELTTIAARPSQGKTALGMQIVENIAKSLKRRGDPGCVAVFSAEMTGWALLHRMASVLVGVNAHKLRMGQGTQEEADKLLGGIERIKNLPIWIDDGSAPTTANMLSSLARLNETNPVRLMMFDFLELGGNRGDKEDQRIGQIAIALKDISKTLGIPVLVLSQVNRSVESRANKMPSLSDLRYSGMIEQISDVVVFIMRPEYYVERGMTVDVPVDDYVGVAYIGIAKNRQGPVTNVKLSFEKQYARFGNLSQRKIMLNEAG